MNDYEMKLLIQAKQNEMTQVKNKSEHIKKREYVKGTGQNK
jgi:hypothetical protein